MKQFITNLVTNLRLVLWQVAIDTLQKEGKWSRTSLTMFSAWIVAIHMAYEDMKKRGFHLEVFLTFVSIAAGVKVLDSWSKKVNPENR